MEIFKDVVKEAGTLFIGLLLLVAGTIDYLLLAFAYRDFSWGLLGMTMLAPIGIPLGYYLLQKGARTDFKHKKIDIRKNLNDGRTR